MKLGLNQSIIHGASLPCHCLNFSRLYSLHFTFFFLAQSMPLAIHQGMVKKLGS